MLSLRDVGDAGFMCSGSGRHWGWGLPLNQSSPALSRAWSSPRPRGSVTIAPTLGYSRVSAIAEKHQAMVYLGQFNSRMKDFYDVWSLATHFPFEGPTLAQAISETFESRGTPLSLHPVAFSDAFTQDGEKQVQWEAFRRRVGIEEVPAGLQEAVQMIAAFLYPVTEALVEGQAFQKRWEPGRRWLL